MPIDYKKIYIQYLTDSLHEKINNINDEITKLESIKNASNSNEYYEVLCKKTIEEDEQVKKNVILAWYVSNFNV